MLWLWLSALHWIKVVRVGFPMFFLILEKNLSVFYHWEWCIIIYGHHYVELHFFYTWLVKSFYHERVLNFIKCFLYIFWDGHTILTFILLMWNIPFIDFVCWIILSFRDKSHLIMVYDPFNVLMNPICQYFFEEFCICVHQGYCPIIFFSCNVLI